MNHPINKAAATLPLAPCTIYTRKSTEASKQPSRTDPVSVWNQSKRILFAVAHKVRRAIRLKLDGHGHAEVEPQELVHDAFNSVMEAMPRFHPATAQFTRTGSMAAQRSREGSHSLICQPALRERLGSDHPGSRATKSTKPIEGTDNSEP